MPDRYCARSPAPDQKSVEIADRARCPGDAPQEQAGVGDATAGGVVGQRHREQDVEGVARAGAGHDPVGPVEASDGYPAKVRSGAGYADGPAGPCHRR